jgi:hypothetical protein
MPKKNPKHEAKVQRQQVITKRGKRIYNWKKIGGILILCATVGVFIILGVVFGSQIGNRAVKEGDTVYIYYELRDKRDRLLENSTNIIGTKFIINTQTEPMDFYENVIGLHEGDERTFTIPGCQEIDPSTGEPNCPYYGGYTTGNLRWEELHYYVKIMSIA